MTVDASSEVVGLGLLHPYRFSVVHFCGGIAIFAPEKLSQIHSEHETNQSNITCAYPSLLGGHSDLESTGAYSSDSSAGCRAATYPT